MAKGQYIRTDKHKPGWRQNCIGIEIATAKRRLAGCPVKAVRNKLILEDEDGGRYIRYHDGMFREDEIACVKWILSSRVLRRTRRRSFSGCGRRFKGRVSR